MTRVREEIINKKIETYIYIYLKRTNYKHFYLDNFLLDYIAFELNCSKTKVKNVYSNLLKEDFETWLHNFKY